MDLSNLDIKFWAGTEESLAVFLLAMRKMMADGRFEMGGEVIRSGLRPDVEGNDEPMPRLYERMGDVGVIKVAGPLVNNDSYYNRYYGVTGYPEIRDALVFGASDEKVGGMVLNVASGGGAVSGVFDTAKLITTIDKKVKPVHSFSSGGVMSAAYLLACSARSLSIDQMTEAGSVGVVAVHQEISKMLEEAGIKATVMRSGRYKALGNPYEPLSEMARAEMQAQLDQLYDIFVQHVADQRSVPFKTADEKMAQGRVFIGARAKEVGLVDDIASFDKIVSKVQGGIDSTRERSKYGANSTNSNNKGMQMPKALTEQDIAALAEGSGASAEASHGAGSGGAPAVAEATPDAAAAVAAAPAVPAVSAAATPAAPAAVEPTALQVVQTQLAESQGKLVELSMQLRDERAAHEAVKGNHASMRAIAVASVERLRVALGQTPGGAEAMADAALLAEHDKLRTAFQTKFKAGGVAAVTPAADASDTKGDSADEQRRQARLKATRLN